MMMFIDIGKSFAKISIFCKCTKSTNKVRLEREEEAENIMEGRS